MQIAISEHSDIWNMLQVPLEMVHDQNGLSIQREISSCAEGWAALTGARVVTVVTLRRSQPAGVVQHLPHLSATSHRYSPATGVTGAAFIWGCWRSWSQLFQNPLYGCGDIAPNRIWMAAAAGLVLFITAASGNAQSGALATHLAIISLGIA